LGNNFAENIREIIDLGFMTKFVGLHIHSDYSLLDGASQLPQLVDRVVELGMPAIALTDHGVMYGAIELIKVCRSKNVKPIIGNEMYIINWELGKPYKGKKYHQVVLAKNTQGYKNLVKLTTISHLQGFQGKGIFARPCINKEVLEQYHEGLIVTSACLGGEIPQAILQNKPELARETAKWYKEVFGDDYYLEIQDHGSQEDRIVNVEIVKIAQELGIKIIATNDSHFTSCNDVEAHDALLCIQTGKLITEDKRMRYSGTEYLKSAAEMALLFRDHLPEEIITQAIQNTLEIAEKVQPYDIMGQPRIPKYPVPSGHTMDTWLEEKTWEGLLERFGYRHRSEIEPVYKERVEFELNVMQQAGFSSYFLVVWDYIKYAREQGIPVGPGRGSAAGSLVAYALGITNIDPVHHGLLFERFLNPERKSMPDIDTDFCIDRRDDMIKYVSEKYGEDKVAQIITFNRLTSKSVLKDVARVLDIPYKESDEMAKMIPVVRGKPTKLKVMISPETPAPEFRERYLQDERVHHWLDMAMRIEGTNKTYGVHAAGVVISSESLDEIVPLQRNNDGTVITQYFMEDLESLGLLKMDFLGLKNLTIIQKTIELISQNKKIDLDPDQFPKDERKTQQILAKGSIKKIPDDIKKTYQILEKGDLEGIFQLESSGMRQIVRDLKPSCIEDISSILALYRPGPLDAGLIPKFIDRKHGREKIQYEHPLLEPILNETYAVLVYQEQIMKMAQDLAGYTLGQADLLRRAMGKKKGEEMQKQRETFIDGSTRNGVTQHIAEHLFDQMVIFAEYCFNKSHSTAYAYVTYQTAYLKANYPTEYMSALLSSNSEDQEKVQRYIATCVNLQIDVLPPDINHSEYDFTPVDNLIMFGLGAVRNLGEGAILSILEARREGGEFTSLADFCDRINLSSINSRSLEALVKSGAFDKLNPNRRQAIEHLKLLVSWSQNRAKDRESGQSNIFDFMSAEIPESKGLESAPEAPNIADFSKEEKLQSEKELLGFYISDHPLKAAKNAYRVIAPNSLAEIAEMKSKAAVTILVMLIDVKNIVTKKGDKMAVVQMEDISGAKIEGVVFPKAYDRLSEMIILDAQLVIWGKVDDKEDQKQIIIEDAAPLQTREMILLEFQPQQLNEATFSSIKALLKEQSGKKSEAKVPVLAKISPALSNQLVRLPNEYWVENSQAAVKALRDAGFAVSTRSFLS
jgi:DNA polymerase-3 subunit alpha